MFDNSYDIKRDFNPLLEYFVITSICTSINNLQSNAPVEHIQQVIYTIIVTKYLDIKVYDYIYPWVVNLASVEWSIRAYYNLNLVSTPVQAVFGRDMLFKLMSIVDWRVVTDSNQQQADINNFQKNTGDSGMTAQ